MCSKEVNIYKFHIKFHQKKKKKLIAELSLEIRLLLLIRLFQQHQYLLILKNLRRDGLSNYSKKNSLQKFLTVACIQALNTLLFLLVL